MRRAVPVVAFLLPLLALCVEARADDAYDDDASRARPTDGASEGDEPDPAGQEGEPETEDLTVGGLRAPSALPEKGDERTDIERSLDEADEKDAGRGLQFVWLEAEFAGSHVAVASLRNRNLVAEKWSGAGLTLGAGLGVRVLYFTLGARVRNTFLPDSAQLLSVLGELGLRVPYGALEPYVLLAVGYAGLNGLKGEAVGASVDSIEAGGSQVRLALGLDYYFSHTFSLGARASTEALFLGRDVGAQECGAETCSLPERGTSTGTALGLGMTLGLHF